MSMVGANALLELEAREGTHPGRGARTGAAAVYTTERLSH